MPDSLILLGVIGRAHGVRGLVHVTSYTADPTDLASYGPLTDERGRRFMLTWRSDGVAELAQLVDGTAVKVADRTAAEKLTNTRLFIDRAALPAAEEDEFYLADLIGAAAVDVQGVPVGRVVTVHDYGAGASLEIERADAPALIVPFTMACVPEIDIAAARVVIAPPDEMVADEPTGASTPEARTTAAVAVAARATEPGTTGTGPTECGPTEAGTTGAGKAKTGKAKTGMTKTGTAEAGPMAAGTTAAETTEPEATEAATVGARAVGAAVDQASGKDAAA